MSEKSGETKKSTKQIIIETAFSFFLEPRYHDFSMNELAAKVGISKAAIYRHFSSKDALLLEMEEHFFDLTALRTAAILNEKNESLVHFAKLIEFFDEHKEFINYSIIQFSRRKDFGRQLGEAMKKRGIKDLSFFFIEPSSSKDLRFSFSRSFYIALSMIFFIKLREISAKQNPAQKIAPSGEFGKKLVEFLHGGLESSVKEGDILFPQKIDSERMKELDEICKIQKDTFPEENPIFCAIAKVSCGCGIGGVTLEKVAETLGMAKSSLYFYFDNKLDMFKSLIERELSLLEEFVRENFAEAKNFSEFAWILLRSNLEFFMTRKSIIPSLSWFLQGVTENPFETQGREISNIWEKRMGGKVLRPDLGFFIKPQWITTWLGCISMALSIVAQNHSLSKEEAFEMLSFVFDFLEFGTK